MAETHLRLTTCMGREQGKGEENTVNALFTAKETTGKHKSHGHWDWGVQVAAAHSTEPR